MCGRERTIRQAVADAGLSLDRLERTKRHFKAFVRNSAGTPRVFTFAMTPSDWRGDLNDAARLRRFSKGLS